MEPKPTTQVESGGHQVLSSPSEVKELVLNSMRGITNSSKTLADVEDRVESLCQSLGFQDSSKLVDYVCTGRSDGSPRPDSEVLGEVKHSRMDGLVAVLPRRDEISAFSDRYGENFSDSDDPSVVEKGITQLLDLLRALSVPDIQPMPEASDFIHTKGRIRLPRRYDPTPLRNKVKELEAAMEKGDASKEGELRLEMDRLMEVEMKGMMDSAISYWDTVLNRFLDRVESDQDRAHLVALTGLTQREDASRVVSEVIDYIASIRSCLKVLPVLVGEAIIHEEHRERIVKAMNSFFSCRFYGLISDSFRFLSAVITFPTVDARTESGERTRSLNGIVQEMGTMLRLPPGRMEGYLSVREPMSKGEKIVFLAALMLYWSLPCPF